MAIFSAGSASVQIVPDFSGAQKAIGEWFARQGDMNVKVKPDLSNADLVKTKAELDSLHGTATVSIDKNALASEISTGFRDALGLSGLDKLGAVVNAAVGPALLASAVGMVTELGAALSQTVGLLALVPAGMLALAAPIAVLKIGLSGVDKAFKDAFSGNTAALQKDLQGLAPAAQQFVLQVSALKPAFESLRLDVQQQLFAGLAANVVNLAHVALPILQTGLAGVAADMNSGLIATFQALARDGAQFTTIFGNITAAGRILAGTMAPLVQSFVTLGAVGSQFLPQIATLLSRAALAAADWVQKAAATGELTKIIQSAISVLTDLVRLLVNVGSIVAGILQAAIPFGDLLLKTLVGLTGQLATFVHSAEGQTALSSFFSSVNQVASTLLPVLAAIAQAIVQFVLPGLGQLAAALAPVIALLGTQLVGVIQQVSAMFPPLSRVVGALVAAFAPLIPQIGQIIVTLLPPLLVILGNLAPVVSAVTSAVADGLLAAVRALAPLLPPLGAAFIAILNAILPLLPALLNLAVSLLPPLVSIIVALLPFLVQFAQVATGIAGVLLAALTPALVGLVNVIAVLLLPPLRLLAPYAKEIAVALGVWFLAQTALDAVVAFQAIGGLDGLIVKLALFVGQLNIVQIAVKVWTAVQWLLNAALAANPIGIVIIALAALGVAIVLIVTHLDFFKNAWNTTWAAVSSFFIATWHLIASTAETVWASIVGFFSPAWASFTASWNNFWNTVSNFFHTVWTAIVSYAQSAWTALVGFFSGSWASFNASWDNLWNGVNTFFHNLWTALISYAESTWTALAGFFTSAWASFTSAWSNFWNAVSNFFHTLWTAFSSFAQATWSTLFSWFQSAWAAYTAAWTNFWNGVYNFFHTLWTTLSTFAQSTWSALAAWFSAAWAAWTAAWQNFWNAVFAFFQNLWNTMVNWIHATWTALAAWFSAAWAAWTAAWQNFWNVVFAFFQNLWNTMVNWIHATWTTLASWFAAAWAAYTAAWNNFWNSINAFLTNIWNTMSTFVRNTWTSLSSWLVAALNTFKGIFTSIWNAISSAAQTVWNGMIQAAKNTWNAIEAAIAKPINFVINTVLNGGLFAGWNFIVDTLGLPGNWHLHLNPIPGFAEGGFTGAGMFGTGGKHDPAGIVHANEFVVKQGPAQEWAPLLEAINSGMAGYADGGAVAAAGQTWQQLDAIRARLFPGSVLTSGYRPGAADYHGLGEAIDIGWAGNDPAHLFQIAATLAQQYPFATELIHNPNGSIKNGHPVPSSFWGAATWAAHANHVHWAMTPQALLGRPGTGVAGVAAVFGSVADVLAKLTSSFAAPVKSLLSQFGNSRLAQVLAKFPVWMADGLWAKGKDAIGAAVNAALSAATTSFADTVSNVPAGHAANVAAVQAVANGYGWGTGAEWDALVKLINSESGFNNVAQNPTSTAYGMFQFLNSTWAGEGGVKTSDPHQQAVLGLKYVAERYHDPIGAWQFHLAHNFYDTGGIVPPGYTTVYNGTGTNEVILNPPQMDNLNHILSGATGGGQVTGTFTGDLYLDSGEFLGKVRGIAQQTVSEQSASDGRNIRSSM